MQGVVGAETSIKAIIQNALTHEEVLALSKGFVARYFKESQEQRHDHKFVDDVYLIYMLDKFTPHSKELKTESKSLVEIDVLPRIFSSTFQWRTGLSLTVSSGTRQELTSWTSGCTRGISSATYSSSMTSPPARSSSKVSLDELSPSLVDQDPAAYPALVQDHAQQVQAPVGQLLHDGAQQRGQRVRDPC